MDIKHQSYWRNKRTVSPECMLPRKKILTKGLSETPYPAFPGSNPINSYVYFVELFSESRYSWFPNRSTKKSIYEFNWRIKFLLLFSINVTYQTYESLTYRKKKIPAIGWKKKKKISTLHVQKKKTKTKTKKNLLLLKSLPPDDFSNGPSPNRMLVLYKWQGTAIQIA